MIPATAGALRSALERGNGRGDLRGDLDVELALPAWPSRVSEPPQGLNDRR